MTDSEKLLEIVDRCKLLRLQAVDGAVREQSDRGVNAQLLGFQVQFDIAGNILELAGQPHGDLDWVRDALGVMS